MVTNNNNDGGGGVGVGGNNDKDTITTTTTTTTNAPKNSSTKGTSLELNQDPWSLFLPTNTSEIDEISKLIEEKLLKQLNKQVNPSKKFNLGDVASFISDGAEVLVDDEFSKCFSSPEMHPWNWNVYLYPVWLFGVFVRYCILFPLRLTCLMVGCFLFAIAFFLSTTFVKNEKTKKNYQRKCIGFLAMVFIMSWSGVIRYHGVKPLRKKNQIFVANHTTVMDVVVLQSQFNYASVGQKHKGLIGFIQNYILNCVGCLWFDRAESKDRLLVAQQISNHIENENNDPLLIFPEGVCVNNQYCVMFKKGAFELPNVIIYPVAIKYNTLFVDAFWNSKKQSFIRHMFNLMTSWAFVCDVWYLEPQTIREGETPTQFANRVKAMIAKKAGIINVPWDGYLKYFKPSSRFAEHKQKIFASRFKKNFELHTSSSNNNISGSCGSDENEEENENNNNNNNNNNDTSTTSEKDNSVSASSNIKQRKLASPNE